MKKNSAGKGSDPRNCFSKDFKQNWDKINWHREKKENKNEQSNTTNIRRYKKTYR